MTYNVFGGTLNLALSSNQSIAQNGCMQWKVCISCHKLLYIMFIFSRDKTLIKLEIRSVERGISPIATSTMNELFL